MHVKAPPDPEPQQGVRGCGAQSPLSSHPQPSLTWADTEAQPPPPPHATCSCGRETTCAHCSRGLCAGFRPRKAPLRVGARVGEGPRSKPGRGLWAAGLACRPPAAKRRVTSSGWAWTV